MGHLVAISFLIQGKLGGHVEKPLEYLNHLLVKVIVSSAKGFPLFRMRLPFESFPTKHTAGSGECL